MAALPAERSQVQIVETTAMRPQVISCGPPQCGRPTVVRVSAPLASEGIAPSRCVVDARRPI